MFFSSQQRIEQFPLSEKRFSYAGDTFNCYKQMNAPTIFPETKWILKQTDNTSWRHCDLLTDKPRKANKEQATYV